MITHIEWLFIKNETDFNYLYHQKLVKWGIANMKLILVIYEISVRS